MSDASQRAIGGTRSCAVALVAGSLLLACLPQPSFGEVARFEIVERKPFAEGARFGEVGSYERIVGKVHYALDPGRVQNGGIVDLGLAPRNALGQVEFWGDLFILAPSDPTRGNGALLYDVNNRGNKLALRFFNQAAAKNDPGTLEDAGDGFLLRHGFVVVWSGWDGELLPGDGRLRLHAPTAQGLEGPLTGLVRCEFVPTQDTKRTLVNWPNHGSYRPTAEGLSRATLTWRERTDAPRQEIPRGQWTIHVTDVEPGTLPKVEVEIPAGAKRGHIYELLYEAQDPLVHGVCFAAVRDLLSALKHGTGAGNPLPAASRGNAEGRSHVLRVLGFGVSQSGRFLREFLHAGFNEDEAGRKVLDGVIPHVSGAGLGSFNHRFAQPTRHAAQHDHDLYPADRFPFAYEVQTDPLSGKTDGILRRAQENGTAPLLLHTQSAAEYWTRSGSPVHTDPIAKRDAEPPENVRIYLFGGTQHGPSGYPPQHGDGQNLANPGDYRPFLRALLLALDRWVRDAVPPPPSVHPTIAAGTLVDWRQDSTRFPGIPGVAYPQVIRQPPFLDLGPRWEKERIIDLQPPVVRGRYPVLVPRCGEDGNELDCLLPPEVAVPVATYTGWNLRRQEAGAAGQLVSLVGSYIRFPITAAERKRTGDPRPSMEERYGSLDEYVRQLSQECRRLRTAGFLLDEDVEQIVRVQKERVAPLFRQIGHKEPAPCSN